MENSEYYSITPKLTELAELCRSNSTIETGLYSKYEVNRGLRDAKGKGVLTGLTEISEVQGFREENGRKIPIDGELFYRGYRIEDLVAGFIQEDRFGFEEITFLLLFGRLPKEKELADFQELLALYRTLPTGFVRDIIMKAPSRDMMNTLSRSVLTLYAYDDKADDISLPNVLRQSLQLIALTPLLAVYGYQTYRHYSEGRSLYIHTPKKELSTAENILRLLRSDRKYTPLEAKLLDLALVLHAEHGGGNNSTFTTHVVTSSGTDTYSSVAASLGSLKGPKHGGANIKVVRMLENIKENVRDWKDEDEVRNYLMRILNREAFDGAGLIYGMGHAVYSISDPRETILKTYARRLSEEKHRTEEFALYQMVERLGAELIGSQKRILKAVSANVDFYSGFVYSMLELPQELFTPIFAVARMSGWSAHRMEELINGGKVIRPAYMNVQPRYPYTALADR